MNAELPTVHSTPSDLNAAAIVPATPPQQHILQLVNGEHFSGAERVQDLLAASLSNFGYAVSFACLKDGKFAASRSTRSAPVHECHMNSRLDFRVVGKCLDLIDQHGYRLLHAHTPRSLMIASLIAARRRLPLVYHVHSPTSRDSTRPLMNRVNAATERLSLSAAHRIVTVSESLAKHVEALGFDRAKIRVVPNGVPTVDVAERQPPQTQWTLATVALFRPRKGTEILLAALRELRSKGHEVRLLAVGGFETTEYEAHLKNLTSEYGLESCVEWLGFQTDVNLWLQQSDLFVLPSLFGEGMPMVVLEAMAMGIPVVGTDVEGVPEVIRDGVDGRIAKAGDVTALADAICAFMTGQLDWLDVRASVVERQRAAFSDQSMAQGVAQIYDELLQPVRV